MPLSAWIVVGIGPRGRRGLVAGGLNWLRAKRTERRRAEARALRQEAGDRARRAQERDARAQDLAKRARDERKHAEKLSEQASKLDPDSDGVRRDDRDPERAGRLGRRRERDRSR